MNTDYGTLALVGLITNHPLFERSTHQKLDPDRCIILILNLS